MPSPPKIIYRHDYQPPPFLVDQIDLEFDIGEQYTHVHSRLVIHRNSQTHASHDLVLDGEAKLLSVSLDGERLPTARYRLEPDTLTLTAVPDSFILEIDTELIPADNTSLMGLYQSQGHLFTQCEPQGFRQMTFYLDRPDVMARFSTMLIANKQAFSALLSNGNKVGEGVLDKKRRWVKWVDPYRKPSYLFALVAGRLVALKDQFITQSGREVALEVWTEAHDQDKAQHAMTSLKRAMRWDEERFDLEYDLDIYMIVAVSDFNMGAMENKGLNIFNAQYVLARPDTATDADYEAIEEVIAHEYFHNWTGNRVTCRDWFQLSLKEGLTVFRDQEFSADMGSRAVRRIKNVQHLRQLQFPEDAGATAHPIRPDHYIEINNFYTMTVYEKGAEVVRMIHTLLGPAGFQKGLACYFKRHDGQAVTCDDFLAAMAYANEVDLEQFARWYSQIGTPLLTIEGHFDQTKEQYCLTVQQSCPGHETNALHIPLALGLLDRDGNDLLLKLEGETQAVGTSRVLDITAPTMSFTFVEIKHPPVISLLRGFSAPVRLQAHLSDEELAFLMMHDSDPFSRWEASQQLTERLLLNRLHHPQESESVPSVLIDAWQHLLRDHRIDPAFNALMLTLPSEALLLERIEQADPTRLAQSRDGLLKQLAYSLRGQWRQQFEFNQTPHYRPEDAARRSLKNHALFMLCQLDEPWPYEAATEQFLQADNMTDQIGALLALRDHDSQARTDCLIAFEQRWSSEALVLDKYFSLLASSHIVCTLDHVNTALTHPAFSLKNPNKVHALMGCFSQNLRHFHAKDGSGYRFIADQVLILDKINPSVASRLVHAFNRWKKIEPQRQALMLDELQRLSATDLSKDVYEIVAKNLQDTAV